MPLLSDPREFVRTVPIVCWYRADNVQRGSGGGVSTWFCPVSGLDLPQASVPNQPTWAIDATIGVPAVGFDSVNHFIRRTTGFSWKLFAVESYYVRAVLQANGLSLNRAIICAGETFGNCWSIESTGVSPNVAQFGGPSTVGNTNTNLTYGVWRSLEATFTPNPVNNYLNVGSVSVSGASVGAGQTSSTTPEPARGFSLGSNLSGGQKCAVTIAEVTVLRGRPSLNERADWAAYEQLHYHGGLVS